jgi:hypothetical protein
MYLLCASPCVVILWFGLCRTNLSLSLTLCHALWISLYREFLFLPWAVEQKVLIAQSCTACSLPSLLLITNVRVFEHESYFSLKIVIWADAVYSRKPTWWHTTVWIILMVSHNCPFLSPSSAWIVICFYYLRLFVGSPPLCTSPHE